MYWLKTLTVATALLTGIVSVTFAEEAVLKSPSETVTREDIERYIRENLPTDPRERQAVLNRPGIYREMAESLYLLRTLADEAERASGIDEAQARWAARMAYQRKMVARYRKTYVDQMLKDVDWDAAAREAYKVDPEKYTREERISASHILIKTDERDEEEALAIAEDLHRRLEEGADFEALAREYSEDGAARNGGHLGFFARGKMTPPFEEAAFALEEKGDFTGPVKTPFGYHLIMLNDRRPGGTVPFEEAKDKIIPELQRKLSNQAWEDKVVATRSAPGIEIDEKLLEALREEYASPDLKEK